VNIELDLHSKEKGEGYDLIFTFESNNYFKETVLKKELLMKHKGILDKCVSTKITWSDGCNPTTKKQKKKKKGKKVNVEVKQDSFFNFFCDIDPEAAEKDEKKDKKEDEDEGSEMEDDDYQKLQDELEMADQFKDDLVPLALEYYLGVIEIEEDSDLEEDDEGDDSDDKGTGDKKKKKGKKGPGGAGGQEFPLGPDGKPQECKQQ